MEVENCKLVFEIVDCIAQHASRKNLKHVLKFPQFEKMIMFSLIPIKLEIWLFDASTNDKTPANDFIESTTTF